jgi:hypothetical protein
MWGKNWYQSKTIWVGILQVAIGVLGLVATFLQAGDYTAPAIVLLVVGVLTIVMRKLTEEPIV